MNIQKYFYEFYYWLFPEKRPKINKKRKIRQTYNEQKKIANTANLVNTNFEKNISKIKEVEVKNPHIFNKEKTINIIELTQQIKKNIIYLTFLGEKIKPLKKYQQYYEKITDLREQSEGMLKILFSIKEKKGTPYFNSVIKAIISHTKTVTELVDTN